MFKSQLEIQLRIQDERKWKKHSNLITIHSEWESLKMHILPWATSDKLSQFLCFYKSDMLLNYALSVSTPYQWCNFQSQLGRKGSCLISRAPLHPIPKTSFICSADDLLLRFAPLPPVHRSGPPDALEQKIRAFFKPALTFEFIICWQGRLLPCDKAFSLYARLNNEPRSGLGWFQRQQWDISISLGQTYVEATCCDSMHMKKKWNR